jgi:hypothetical protein
MTDYLRLAWETHETLCENHMESKRAGGVAQIVECLPSLFIIYLCVCVSLPCLFLLLFIIVVLGVHL